MLHKSTVDPALLRVLEKLMALPQLQDMRLVGGTALALMLGHRVSVDIDLFGKVQFDDELLEKIKPIGNVLSVYRSKNINTFIIDDVKVDFVNYRYPWIHGLVSEQGIQMASKQDIAAMKFNAIAGRGSKKDFIDLYYLLQEFSFEEMFSFYVAKFDDGNPFLVRKSLVYFANADEQTTPEIFESIGWEAIKKGIIDQFRKEGY